MYQLPAMPPQIKVGVNMYRVELVSPLESMQKREWGSVAHTEQLIRYQSVYPCPGQALDTVIHELLHCCYGVYRIGEAQDEETTVNALAPTIAAILIDNPQLSEALAQIAADARRWHAHPGGF